MPVDSASTMRVNALVLWASVQGWEFAMPVIVPLGAQSVARTYPQRKWWPDNSLA
jgi:hypothetical protein